MNRDEFFKEIIETIQAEDDVSEVTLLSEIYEWDSLASVTALALFNKHLDLKISASQIKFCNTIKDILDLGNEKYDQ